MSETDTDDTPRFGFEDTSFKAAGGIAGIEKLVDDFYRIMDELPQAKAIRDMHPADLTISRDKLARFLCGWLGGPKRYQEKYGGISIPKVHQPVAIGPDDRDAWLECMRRAAELQPYSDEFKEYLLVQLAVPAQRIVDVNPRQTQAAG